LPCSTAGPYGASGKGDGVTTRSGGQILIDALKIHGVDVAFEVPGESYIAVLDALYDAPEIRLITCRQEGGAAYMADAYGKLTGRPGICFVTRGPGATNASVGIHTARHDSTPMILFIGQVARDSLERDAFQEVDYRQFFGRLAKWVGQIDDPRRIPDYVSHAFHRATSGRHGPVVLALPDNMLAEQVDVPDAQAYHQIVAHPGAEDLRRIGELLAAAQRPVMSVGGGGWSAQGYADLHAFAEAHEIAVVASFRRQDRFDTTHRLYAGYIGAGGSSQLVRRIKEGLNPQLAIRGVLITMFDGRTKLATEVLEEVHRYFPDRVFQTQIPRNIRLSEAPSYGKPAILFDVKSRGAQAYLSLARELAS